jgi:hypothetical protein
MDDWGSGVGERTPQGASGAWQARGRGGGQEQKQVASGMGKMESGERVYIRRKPVVVTSCRIQARRPGGAQKAVAGRGQNNGSSREIDSQVL